jgi:hypothetical protein
MKDESHPVIWVQGRETRDWEYSRSGAWTTWMSWQSTSSVVGLAPVMPRSYLQRNGDLSTWSNMEKADDDALPKHGSRNPQATANAAFPSQQKERTNSERLERQNKPCPVFNFELQS